MCQNCNARQLVTLCTSAHCCQGTAALDARAWKFWVDAIQIKVSLTRSSSHQCLQPAPVRNAPGSCRVHVSALTTSQPPQLEKI